jgi:hypothetical protein
MYFLSDTLPILSFLFIYFKSIFSVPSLSLCFQHLTSLLLCSPSSGYLVQMGCVYYSVVRLQGGLDGKPTLLEPGISGPNAPWIWNSRRHKIRPHAIILRLYCSPNLFFRLQTVDRVPAFPTLFPDATKKGRLLVELQQGVSQDLRHIKQISFIRRTDPR